MARIWLKWVPVVRKSTSQQNGYNILRINPGKILVLEQKTFGNEIGETGKKSLRM